MQLAERLPHHQLALPVQGGCQGREVPAEHHLYGDRIQDPYHRIQQSQCRKLVCLEECRPSLPNQEGPWGPN